LDELEKRIGHLLV